MNRIANTPYNYLQFSHSQSKYRFFFQSAKLKLFVENNYYPKNSKCYMHEISIQIQNAKSIYKISLWKNVQLHKVVIVNS